MTVPTTALPPTAEFGATEMDCKAGRLTVNVAVCVVPEYDAAIVTVAGVGVSTVSIWNVVVEVVDDTVTLDGTIAATLLLLNATTMPPVGAAAESETVPVADVPATIEVDETLTDASVAVVVGAVLEDEEFEQDAVRTPTRKTHTN